MKLGAVDNILRCNSEMATFMLAKRLGLEGLEVSLSREQIRDPKRQRLERLRDAKMESGLEIPSLMLGYLNNGGLASADPSLVDAAKQDIRIAIDWADELGAGIILVPFFFGGDILTEDDFHRAVQGFRELCPLAAEKQIKLCYEGTLPAGQIRQMAQAVDSPAFACYFDLANVVWLGLDTATEIRILDTLIEQVHMKESRVGPGDCVPGHGRVDYIESARALQENGYDGWIVLETPAAPPELIARDISFTRTIFPSLTNSGKPWPQIGAFSYGFKRGEWDRMITTFKEYGLTAVQIGSDLLEEALDNPDKIPAIRQKLEDNGITVTAIAGYRNLVAPDEAKLRANIDFIKRCLEVAQLFGTSVVATETGTRNSESDWKPAVENRGKEAWQVLNDALDELLPVAREHGAILALEGYVNNVLQTVGQMTGVLERYPTAHLGVVLDPFNYLSIHLLPARERIVVDFLNRFEYRFVLAHLKDVSEKGAEIDTPEFGTGVFPHKLYFEFLKNRRPDLPIILEHLPLDHIPAAVDRIHQLARELESKEG